MGKNHHYVPQFYLKLFSNNSKSIGTWNSETDKIITDASIANMASRANLYGNDQALESEFASWEKDWSITINKIISTNQIQNLKELASILTFFTIGRSRTLKRADTSNYTNDYFAKLMLSNKFSQDLLDSVKIGLDIPNLASIKASAELTYALSDLQYVIIENTSSVAFITSDNPICCYNKFYIQRGYMRNYGWGTAGLIILLPLTPQKCLCFYDPMVYQTISSNLIVINSGNSIIHINRLLTQNAYHNIFFNNQKNNCIEDIKKSHRPTVIEDTIQSFGPLIQISEDSILNNYNLNFLKIRKKFKTIPLPAHMGGLMRPLAIQYRDEHCDKFNAEFSF